MYIKNIQKKEAWRNCPTVSGFVWYCPLFFLLYQKGRRIFNVDYYRLFMKETIAIRDLEGSKSIKIC